MKPSEMASLSNNRWQNCKELSNPSTTNGDMDDKAKRPARDRVCDIYVSYWKEAKTIIFSI